MPDELERIVNKALQKKPEDRYQTIDAMLKDLQALAEFLINGKSTSLLNTFVPKAKVKKSLLYPITASLILMLTIFGIYISQEDQTGEVNNSIAVLPFAVDGAEADWSWLGRGISELLGTELGRANKMRILGAQQQISMMRKLGYDNTALHQEEAVKLARMARIEFVLLGSLEISDRHLEIQARVLESSSGKILKAFEPVQGEIDEINELAAALSGQIFQSLKLESPQETVQTFFSLEAQRYYIEGLDAAFDMRNQESIAKLRRAIALDSTFIKAYYYLAWQYRLIRDYTSAKKILAEGEPFITHLSDEARLEYLLNEASIDHRWRDYANYLELLIKINPYNASYRFLYGRVQYVQFRMVGRGIALMEKSLELDSTYSYAYNSLAFAYLVKGDIEKSLELIEKYIALNPVGVNPLDSKAEIQVLTGRYDEAIENCENILELQPGYENTLNNLARTYMARGQYTRAMDLLQTAKEQEMTSTAMSNLCMLEARSQRAPEHLG